MSAPEKPFFRPGDVAYLDCYDSKGTFSYTTCARVERAIYRAERGFWEYLFDGVWRTTGDLRPDTKDPYP